MFPNRAGKPKPKNKIFLRRKTREPSCGLGAPPVGRPRTIKNSSERRPNSRWRSARERREQRSASDGREQQSARDGREQQSARDVREQQSARVRRERQSARDGRESSQRAMGATGSQRAKGASGSQLAMGASSSQLALGASGHGTKKPSTNGNPNSGTLIVDVFRTDPQIHSERRPGKPETLLFFFRLILR